MKVQHRIDELIPNTWPRPLAVTLQDGNLLCAFGAGRRYELQSSYTHSPHAQFLNARSDDQMRVFVKEWGPLYFRTNQRGVTPVTFPVAEYHIFRRRFAALHSLVDAVGTPKQERERLTEFVEAAAAHDTQLDLHMPDVKADELRWFRESFGIGGPLSEWVLQASAQQVRSAIQWIVPMCVAAPRAEINVVRRGKGYAPQARWALGSLQEALHWMLWFDVFRDDPLYCCQECRKFFKSDSKHERKFCDDPTSNCAKRATQRNWARKSRAAKRSANEKLGEQEKVNVTHKAR